MSASRWERITEVCDQALRRAPEERNAFVRRACGSDDDLYREVLSLLAQHQPSFLETPVVRMPVDADGAGMGDGATVGPYRIVRPLGRGGMGDVFLAVGGTAEFEHPVAVKLVRAGTDSAAVVERFRRERQMLAMLRHPHIAALLDGGSTSDGTPYVVMEYVDGTNIDAYCDAKQLGVAERIALIQRVCRAVHHAHQNLVVHRDIKPSNILVSRDGTPKLLDFGIGKMLEGTGGADTGTVTRLFTPRYASPEQIRGEPITTQADVYSLGVVLYELLSGAHPYGAGPTDGRSTPPEVVPPPSRAVTGPDATTADSAHKRRTTPHALRRTLSGDLDRIVLKAMHAQPDRRYTSPGDLADDLQRYLDGRPVLARPDSVGYRLHRFVRRNAWATAAVGAVAVAVVMAIVFPWINSRKLEADRDRALEVQGFLLEAFGASGAGRERGDTLTAGGLLDRQAATLNTAYGGRPQVHAAMRVALADAYERLGLYAQSAAQADTAVQLYRAAAGTRSSDLAAALNMLGWAHFQLGDLDSAERFLSDAVAMRRDLGRRHRAELARSLNDLGVVLARQGKYAVAADRYEEALVIRRAVLGPAHRGTAISASNLAAARYQQGNYAEASRLGTFAVGALEAALGPDHQRTIIARGNLAVFQAAAGDLEGARATYRDLLDRETRLQGRSHPVTLGLMTAVAGLDFQLGDYDAAEALLVEALGHYREQFGPDDPRSVDGLQTLANLTARRDGTAAAAERFEHALAVISRAYGPVHPEAADTYIIWGEAWNREGQYAQAANRFERALTISAQALGDTHFRTTDIRLRLAHALRHAGRPHAARAAYERVLHDLDGTEHVDRLNDARLGWAQTQLRLGDTVAADSMVRVVRAAVDGQDTTRGQVQSVLESLESALGRRAAPADTL